MVNEQLAFQDKNELSDSQLTGTDCNTIIEPVIEKTISHHTTPMEKIISAQQKQISEQNNKINQLYKSMTSLTNFIKEQRSPYNVSDRNFQWEWP